MGDFTIPYLDSFIYLILSLVFLIIGRYIYALIHNDIQVNHELVKKDNTAFGFAQVGYFSGIVAVMVGAISGKDHDLLWVDVLHFSLFSLLGILLLNASIIINDKLIFHKFNLKRELCFDQNKAVGVIQGAIALGSGLLIFGALNGNSDHATIGQYQSALIFWAVGILLFFIATFIYNSLLPFSLHQEIEVNNTAVGVAYAGVIISIANIVRHGIEADFENWKTSALTIFTEAIIALILLPLVRFFTDKILLPGERLTDELVNQEKPNVAAGVIEGFTYVFCSVVLIEAI